MSDPVPVAFEVPSNTLVVDTAKLSEHLAKEEVKLLRERHEVKLREAKRLVDARLQFEKEENADRAKERKFLTEARLANEKEQNEGQMKRLEAEWRLQQPTAARIKDEQEMKARELVHDAAMGKWRLAQDEKDRQTAREIKLKKQDTESELALAEKHAADRMMWVRTCGVVLASSGVGLILFSFN